MRIIAGSARGRRLAAPPGTATRPTSDRAREGLFATVTALRGPLPGARVLDLFAGSGAIGLEALSRGAVRAVFVESDPRAAQVIRDNMAAVGAARRRSSSPLPGGQRFLDRGPGDGGRLRRWWWPIRRTRLGGHEVTGMLTALASRGWLAPRALVAVERATRSGLLCVARRVTARTGPAVTARRPSGTVSPQLKRRKGRA